MTNSRVLKTIFTALTTLIYAYPVYLVIKYGMQGGYEDMPIETLPAFFIPVAVAIVWAIVLHRFWWILAVGSTVLFTSIGAAGATLLGFFGIIGVPYACCLLMLLTKPVKFGDATPEWVESIYYGEPDEY